VNELGAVNEDLVALLTDVLAEKCTSETVEAAEGGWSPELWASLDELGLTAVGVDEEAGGSGGTLLDALTIVRAAAGHAAPVPLAHTLIVGPDARRRFGLAHRPGPTAVALYGRVRVEATEGDRVVRGSIENVPYGRFAENLILIAEDGDQEVAVELDGSALAWEERTNVAGEPRDGAVVEISLNEAAFGVAPAGALEEVRGFDALAQCWAMIGAMQRVGDLITTYTRQREQFGRPLSSFQAVKQLAAVVAGEIAVSSAAASTAATHLHSGRAAGFPIAAARVRCAAAVTPVTRHAHQLHGAIGYTREYPLHQFTRRLWAWRDEGRTQRQWTRIAGERVLAAGPDRLWESIAG